MITQSPSRSQRKAIGVLIDHADYLSAGYETQLRSGFHSACQEFGLDLFFFFGRPLEDPGYRAQNSIYDLAHTDCLDGVIAVSPGLAAFTGAPGVQALLEKMVGLPRCSLGMVIPGIPSVVADNTPGMRAAVEHLIDVHGCRRLAYLGGPSGNPDASLRRQVFLQVLAERGIVHDPALETECLFTLPRGIEAMREILSRGVAFDAVVGANDGIALGAIDALKAAGWRVPRGVRVTGFDDAPLARICNPSLTTVRQPLVEMARCAVATVRAGILGQQVPDQRVLPVTFVARRSCGCFEDMATRSKRSHGHDLDPDVRIRRVASCLKGLGSSAAVTAEALVRAEQPIHVRDWLEDWMAQAAETSVDYDELDAALAELRRTAPSEYRHDDGWFEVFALTARERTYAQARNRAQADVGYWHLLRGGERLLTAFELSEVAHILATSLPRMGVHNAQLSLYTDDSRRQLRSFLCLRGGKAQAVREQPYAATELVPDLVGEDADSGTYFVWPLAVEADQFGIFVLQVDPRAAPHEMLREQVSAALKSVKLQREIIETTAAHERGTQERLATARRMHALNVLAGGVAHDLNNSLGPLVGLPDVILRELEGSLGERSPTPLEVPEVRADIAAIKTAALRAAQTIKDLLTSARQGRTSKDSLDLNRVVVACVQQERSHQAEGSISTQPFRKAGRPEDAIHGVEIVHSLWPDALIVKASEAHLLRAISNLLRNAREAIDGRGRVSVSTRGVVLQGPLAGYETIAAGSYAVVCVEDTGRGIPQADLGRVFEPFFSKKRTGEHSGSGLGLSVVHGVVKEHGGFLDVESTPGVGTRFTLYFERSRESLRPREEPPPSVRSRKVRIWVVDDDALQLRTAARVLSHQGHEVTTETSGRRACERFELASRQQRESPCDLLILDVQLGEDVDGLGVLEKVQRLFPEQRAIMVSGHATLPSTIESNSRFAAWLPKPYTLDQLGRAVQSALADAVV
ncbi:MAG TPA: substrate-binding domain-containing protein [Polyangiaceae bacterium]|nr:substrate-binding domain-containing protein [Polyangiaceae bacterium]